MRVTRGDVGLRVTRGEPGLFDRERRAGRLGLRVTRKSAENFEPSPLEKRESPLGLRVTRDDSKRDRQIGVGLRVTRSDHVNMDGFKSAEKLEGKSPRGIVDYFGRI